MGARMKLTRRNCAYTRRAVVNVRREHVISNFDTKTIRVSSSPTTLSYLTRCLGSLYGDAGGRVRNEEKGKGRESCKRTDTREEAKMRPRTGGRDKGSEEEKERNRSKARDMLSEFKADIVTMFRFCHRVHNTKYRIRGHTSMHAVRSLVASICRDIKNSA